MTENNTYDIYFYEAFEEEAAALKHFLKDSLKAGFTWKSIQESGDEEPPARLISLRTQTDIPAAWAKKLKGILTRSTGYDHLIRYRRSSGIDLPFGYLPLYCHRSVAEQALMLWMSLLRKLPQQIVAFGDFNRDGLSGSECDGKTLLVVGVGHIGYEVVKIGKGLQMHTLGVDIVQKYDDVDYVDIQTGMKQADIIVCCMNLTRKNQGYFNRSLFKQTKPNVILVNPARGELTPSREMLYLIKNKIIAGLALDVYENESELSVSFRSREKSNDPAVQAILELRQYPNVIFTPHNAFNTQEAVMRKSEQSIQQAIHFLEKGSFIWKVPEE
ncbi:MAG: hydroxyacid dehydrogenase [Calditrichaceae bacterium]|nr:hydroxyacid dehydrogenase [Calditrichaceae bacterium]MBN2709049.1 hydroxyacid dehydrogenase [Calditrichaceae bacterium]RQV97007.1 MAG: hydroxyacid dehydrogenase [Calditrichota bacterium]